MVCIEYILPFRLIIYVLYSFTRSFFTFYMGLLFTRTVARVNLLSIASGVMVPECTSPLAASLSAFWALACENRSGGATLCPSVCTTRKALIPCCESMAWRSSSWDRRPGHRHWTWHKALGYRARYGTHIGSDPHGVGLDFCCFTS